MRRNDQQRLDGGQGQPRRYRAQHVRLNLAWPSSKIRQLGSDMAKPEEPYILIVVETYLESGSGLHGDLHVRPIAGQSQVNPFRKTFVCGFLKRSGERIR